MKGGGKDRHLASVLKGSCLQDFPITAVYASQRGREPFFQNEIAFLDHSKH